MNDNNQNKEEQPIDLPKEQTDSVDQQSSLSIKNPRITEYNQKQSTFSSYIVYSIEYEKGIDSIEIYRRYSDFDVFRQALRRQLPCHFIFPAHRKRAMVN